MLEADKKITFAHSRAAFLSRFVAITALSVWTQRYAFGTAYTYSNGGGTLTWSSSGNWSPAGIPGNGDSASILSGPGGPTNPGWNVTYNYSGAAVTLSSLILSHSSATLHSADNLTLNSETTVLTATNEYLGDSGSKGYGAISQSSGTNSVTTALQLGVDATDIGTYNLSGDGQLNITGTSGVHLDVGVSGSGNFNQTGGTANLGFGNLNVGGSGGGAYIMSSGSLTGSTENIGTGTGTGTFTQSGGTSTFYNTLNIGAKGAYALSLTASLSIQDAPTNVTGGTFSQIDTSTASLYAMTLSSGGSYSLGGSANLTIGSNTSGSGYYLNINTGTFTLSQSAVLAVHGNEQIGVNSGDVATFTQSGGQHSVDYGTLNIGAVAGASGSYVMSGGTLSTQTENIGNTSAGTGTFSQSGGTHSVQTLNISTGSSYTLSNTGSLVVTNGENITGTFTQNGGNNFAGAASSDNVLALEVEGNYQFTAGTLDVSGLELVAGVAMTQSGGTSTVTATQPGAALAIVGDLNGGTASGTYTLGTGASLTVNGELHVGGVTLTSAGETLSEALPTGVLNVTGGTLVVSDLIKLWTGTGNAINFSAGTISTPALQGDASGFNWTGGTLTISGSTGLTIGNNGFFTNLVVNNGMTLNTSALNIATGGMFTLSGGTLNGSGLITLSGGTFSGGSSALTNSLQITGYGAIGGSGGFTNTGAITIPSGAIVLSNSGGATNSGTISLSPATQLQLSGGDLGNTGTINLNGATISGTRTLFNNSGGVITGYGAIATPLSNQPGGNLLIQTGQLNLGPAITNFGVIDLVGPGATLSGGGILNKGVIEGTGIVNNTVSNTSTGEIRATAGTWLTINSLPGGNAGKINLVGGTVEIVSALSNSGTITGHGELYADAELTNTGKMLFSAGYTDLYGAVTNNSGGTITITGGGTTTFYNAFNNSGGSVQISSDSIAAFEGSVTGAGGFTGSGLKIFDGGMPSSVVTLASIVGDTVVEPGAHLTVNSFNENAIDVEGNTTVHTGGTMNETNSLTIGSAGALDLGNNSLTVLYTGPSPAALIRTYLSNGYNSGHWNGVGGIDSSVAGLNAGTALGYSDNGTQVLIKYTWLGDANLDGIVNNADLALFSSVGSTWNKGDFNYDGHVNADDYALFMLGATVGTQNISTTLPEPGGTLVLLCAGMLKRRRRM